MLEKFSPMLESCHCTKEDKLLIAVFKLRHNLDYKMISNCFRINSNEISQIFQELIIKLYNMFKKIDIWNMSQKNENLYRSIIDCTEMPIASTSNPEMSQNTFSNYKNRNTFKGLVSCDEYGAVNFISDLFGGSISDREITVKSQFIDKLVAGECVLADRGFEISDLLEDKGVALNIPPFMRGKLQLSEKEVMVTRAIANRRILIEQINARAKKNKILVDVMPVCLWPLANKIFFVCFMFVNFYNPIV